MSDVQPRSLVGDAASHVWVIFQEPNRRKNSASVLRLVVDIDRLNTIHVTPTETATFVGPNVAVILDAKTDHFTPTISQ